jgi:hypothetical protein
MHASASGFDYLKGHILDPRPFAPPASGTMRPSAELHIGTPARHHGRGGKSCGMRDLKAMLKRLSAGAMASALMLALAGSAYSAESTVPPQNGKKLSEIIAKVEQRPDFEYVGEIDWDDGGYEVTYYTTDHAKVEMKFDPVTGEPKSLQ